MKLTLPGMFALKLVALVALLIGAISLASDTATAQSAPQPPDDGNETTTGTAGGSATNASVFNIADLKADDGPLCDQVGSINPADYDDDPGASPFFHVAPNLGDVPLQCVNKYVFINNPDGVDAIQKYIRAVIPGTEVNPGTTQVVFHDQRLGSEIATRDACVALLGDPATPGSVAHGLITTGQKTAQEITDIRNGCIQGHVGVLVNPFPVSKHLPPGWYQQCAVLGTTGGGATPEFCTFFNIQPITGFTEDVTTIDYGVLTQGRTSFDIGDFNIGTPDIGTVMGLGNTSPILQVSYSDMENEVGTVDEADNKYITGVFDVQINRRNEAGNIIDFQHIDNLEGGGQPDQPNPFNGATVATLNEICLEPNEPLKLDFSVTPRDILFPGIYTGLARLVITEQGACAPTLGSGESASGDDDGVFNNMPGMPVQQTPPTT